MKGQQWKNWGCRDPCDHTEKYGPNPHGQSCYDHHSKKRLQATTAEKQGLLEMFDGQCCYGVHPQCPNKKGLTLLLEVDPTHHRKMIVEHCMPFSRGGYDGMENWVPSCKFCNGPGEYGKGTQDDYQYCIR